jgi:hypothetical protein
VRKREKQLVEKNPDPSRKTLKMPFEGTGKPMPQTLTAGL